MSTTSFASPSELKKFISQSSLEEFKEILSRFSFSELADCLILLQSLPPTETKNKIDSWFHFLDSPTTLEILGKHFSTTHFLGFLEFLNQHPDYQNRLAYVLVGLHPLIFSQTLGLLQNNHLVFLKQESVLEPLHYHLIQFLHEGEALRHQTEQKAQQFMQTLKSTKLEELTQVALDTLIAQINSLRDHLLNYLERISTALSIVWHTDRIDLIEKLSSINESLQYQLSHMIGHPQLNHHAATGLYLTLEQTLSSIYDSALKDDDAAVEGLTRLSIWHLKDYWEIGLLPFIHHIQELDLDIHQYNEEERRSHHQNLFSFIQLQLDRLQIGTVDKLKKSYLFSKPLLKDYIKKHQDLLLKNVL